MTLILIPHVRFVWVEAQINLFLAIKLDHDAAVADLKHEALDKYLPSVPLLIGQAVKLRLTYPYLAPEWMYNSLMKYLFIEYVVGKALWEKCSR